MLNVIKCNQEQIDKITNLVKNGKLINLKFDYDSEDKLGFISCNLVKKVRLSIIGSKMYKVYWRVTQYGEPEFFELLHGYSRYDIDTITGDLYFICSKVGKKLSDDFWKGNLI
jgi:hypothetical protein